MSSPYSLIPTMRWFGPSDPVSLAHLAQAGCEGVVSALHAVPVGEVWSQEAIRTYQQQIEAAGLHWEVVESLPVHEDIKSGRGEVERLYAHYRESLVNLAVCGIKVVTYNFMPVLDWVRTDLAHILDNGAEALLFNRNHYRIFDLLMLQRPGAEQDYTEAEQAELRAAFAAMTEADRAQLYRNVLLGLPGSDEPFTAEQVLQLLAQYKDIRPAQLRDNLVRFLQAITPTAEALGIQLAIHPDDPPFSVLGLPRIVSTPRDIEEILTRVPSPANGLCFCTGSLGSRADNDLLGLLEKWGSRVYFLHLRNTQRTTNGNFMEAPHLDGDTDMYAIMEAAVQLMQRENRRIPMRPDHGHKMLDDLSKTTYPGYSGIGRLKGLAELRGLEYGIQRSTGSQVLGSQ